MKPCSKCGQTFEAEALAGGGKGIKRAVCKPCWAAYMREYNSRPGNREKVRELNRRYKVEKPRAYKNSTLMTLFGISLAEYEQMHVAQAGCCAICERPETEFKKKLAVDHCHKGSHVRGLLCSSCNVALGLAGDDPDRLRRMADYLETSGQIVRASTAEQANVRH